jgi:hypothetical protein
MRIIRAQINWPRTENSSRILLKDFFNNIGGNQSFDAMDRNHAAGANFCGT